MGAFASFIRCFPSEEEPAQPSHGRPGVSSYRGVEGRSVAKKADKQEQIDGLRSLLKELQEAASGLKPGKGDAHDDPNYTKGSGVITKLEARYIQICAGIQAMYFNVLSGQGSCQRYNPSCERCLEHGCACGYLLSDSTSDPIQMKIGDKPVYLGKQYNAGEKTPSDEEKECDGDEWLQPGATVSVGRIRGPVSNTDHRIRAEIKQNGDAPHGWFTLGSWDQDGKRQTSECRVAAMPTEKEYAQIYAEISTLSKLLQETRIAFDKARDEFNSVIDTCKCCHTTHWGDSFIELHANQDSTHKTCRRCAKAWVSKLVKYGANDRCCVQHSCMLPPSNECVEFALESKEEAGKYWCRMIQHKLGQIPDIRFCPGPRCGQAIVVNLDDNCLNVSCPLCELKFCRDCQNEWHSEIGDGSCIDFVKYQLRTVHGEEEVAKEMQHWKYSQRTGRKRCPCCRVMIEKNQGCQHMTCKKCTHQFYWCCGGDYTGPRKGCICANKADKQAPLHLAGKRFDDVFVMSEAIEVV